MDEKLTGVLALIGRLTSKHQMLAKHPITPKLFYLIRVIRAIRVQKAFTNNSRIISGNSR